MEENELKEITIKSLFDLSHTILKDYLLKFEYPFEALEGLSDEIVRIGNTLDKTEYQEVKPQVWVHHTAHIFDSAYLGSPLIVCKNAEIRHCAFIRGSAVIGENAVVGNSCELKNVILFDNVQTPHYNYVGDSILGYKAHMGAGSITSNVKSDKSLVVIHSTPEVKTNRKKVGAFLGDYVEVGCNSVLNPGTVIGRNSNVYPLSMVRGVIDSDSIFKQGIIVKKK